MTAKIGALLWVASTLAYFAAEAIAAAALPGYSYVADYISRLGLPRTSPRAGVMNAAFLVQGVFFPVGAALLARGVRERMALPFLAFATLNGVGNVLVGLVPGDGSVWHLAGAVLAIVGGNLAILVGAPVLRRADTSWAYLAMSVALGLVGLFCVTVFALDALPIGVWERGCVYSIYVWQVATAVVVLRGGRLSVS